MAKAVDKRLNYKHCFDALFRVSLTSQNTPALFLKTLADGARGGLLFAWSRSWSKCSPCHPDECQSIGIVRICPFDSQFLLPPESFDSYDFFKHELLKTKYFDDNMACHITASFGAVCVHSRYPRACY